MGVALLRGSAFLLGLAERCVARGSLPRWMQRFEECDERGGLRGTQILPICRHVAASLDHLADELVLRQSHRNAVQSWASLSAILPEGMAVATLLGLENERALPLERSRAMHKFLRHGVAAPGVHIRTPLRIASEMGECSQDYGDQQNRQNSDWPPAPTLFPFSRKKWQQNKKRDNDYGANEESRRLHCRRQV